jgi:hypothetical protein
MVSVHMSAVLYVLHDGDGADPPGWCMVWKVEGPEILFGGHAWTLSKDAPGMESLRDP